MLLTRNRAESHGDLGVRDQETGVVVVSVGKSGTHLVLSALRTAGFHIDDFGFGAHSIHGRASHARRLLRQGFARDSVDVGLNLPACVATWWLAGKLARRRGCALGAHAAYSEPLRDLIRAEGFRIVQVVRDPRAVVASQLRWVAENSYITSTALARQRDPLAAILKGYRAGPLRVRGLPTILDRAQGWLLDEEIYSVRFEDLIGPRGGGSADRQREVLRRLSAVCGFEDTTIAAARSNFGMSKTFDRGQVDSWQDELSAEQIRLIDDALGPRLGIWGYGPGW